MSHVLRAALLAATLSLLVPAASADVQDASSKLPPVVIVAPCATYDRACHPTYEQYAFGCELRMMNPFGGVAGATFGYGVGMALLGCDTAGEAAGRGADAAGDTTWFAVGQAQDAVLYARSLDTDPAGTHDLVEDEARDLLLTAFVQGHLACVYATGSGCYDTAHNPDDDPAEPGMRWECQEDVPPGGVVGDTVDYVAAACHWAGWGVLHALAEAEEYADETGGQADRNVAATQAYVAGRVPDTRAYLQEVGANVAAVRAAAVDAAAEGQERTCTYLIGQPCPPVVVGPFKL